ncbi:MAG: hypothetical protein AAGA02_01960 [Bacteroidota bacterium]
MADRTPLTSPMHLKGNPYLLLILSLTMALLFHGTSFFSTLEGTYDFYVHVFFGDHYARSWFDPWEPRWYTGFNLTSYPPLAHQLIALLSILGGLKAGAFLLTFGIILLYVSGAYRFAKLVTSNETAAGYTALIAVFLPSVVEALHVFGQLPSMLGISWLLHALPEIYLWIRFGKWKFFRNSISLIAVAVCSHHVTPIFGMVFFVLPLIGTAVLDGARTEVGRYEKVTLHLFFKYVKKYLFRIIGFGLSTILVAVMVILPYWLWSKSDPITQVPIPHGSRDNFFEVFSSGLVFFIIPWGFLLVLLPYIFYRYFSKRNVFIGLSFTLLFVLGTGGSTPIPRMLLGDNAFNILTLERFTFWATIWAMPMAGEFIWSFFSGPIRYKILVNNSKGMLNLLTGIMVVAIFCSAGLTLNLSYFRPLQPEKIDIKPIVNFINTDKHYKWRYLTLGFGDQMAWLSANTNAQTIDGNYHSARRVPELTTRAIERLENAKYRGTEGVGTLQQFLTNPDKFHLKYIFSNDKFYDPQLYFSGWQRVKKLDNGIMVWEREDVSPLPSILPKKETPAYQKVLWGIVPILCLTLAIFFNIQLHWINHIAKKNQPRTSYSNPEKTKEKINRVMYYLSKYWFFTMAVLVVIVLYQLYVHNEKQNSPEKVVFSYFDAIDFKNYEMAYSYLDAGPDYPLDQFMLENSITDGIVDSYGKIDAIETTLVSGTDSMAIVDAKITYVTPLDIYYQTKRQVTRKINGKWYIEAEPLEYAIPARQFVSANVTDFRNQGRKRISTEETFHTDIIDRPVLQVLQANLIQSADQVYIVGELQNIDAYPADITIAAELFGNNDELIAESSEDMRVVHKLLPKEITPFKLSFPADSLLSNFPCNFNLEVLGSVTSQDLYKRVAATHLNTSDTLLSGILFNQGNETATISQLLIGYYSSGGDIIDVEQKIVAKSIFPRRSEEFDFKLINYSSTIISRQAQQILVNGIDNELIIQKYKSDVVAARLPLLRLSDQRNISVSVNNFIGSPGKF